MTTSEEQRRTDIPKEERGKEAEAGRSAPIDEDVEEELNAALPEPPDEEQEPAQETS